MRAAQRRSPSAACGRGTILSEKAVKTFSDSFRRDAYASRFCRFYTFLQNVLRYQAADAGGVGAAGELKAHLAEAGEPELKLAVEVEEAGGLD